MKIMKITNVKAYVVNPPLPEYGSSSEREWTFVQIDTDEGITGWGEATNYPGGGSFLTAQAVLMLKKILNLSAALAPDALNASPQARPAAAE